MSVRHATVACEMFWGELAPCDQLVQVYDDESQFIETLQRFVGDGLRAGEAVVLIATASHLTWVEARLRDAGHDIVALRAADVYIAMDAASTLAQGHSDATVRLEHLWNALIHDQGMALFCAYPRIGATRDLRDALDEVCALHSKVSWAGRALTDHSIS